MASKSSVSLVLFSLLIALLSVTASNVVLDNLQLSVDLSFRGSKETASNYAISDYYAHKNTPTEYVTVSFTVKPDMPDEFDFKLLAKDVGDMGGTFAPVHEAFYHDLKALECSSGDVAVTIKAANEDPTTINIDGNSVDFNSNDIFVKKNGILEDTTVTCSYYIRRPMAVSFDFAQVYVYYSYVDQQTTISDHRVASASYYNMHNIYVSSVENDAEYQDDFKVSVHCVLTSG
jgi:hypothetical protein